MPISKVFRVLEQIRNNHKSRAKTRKHIIEEFKVTKLLGEGCCISPPLFKIYLVAALNKWKWKILGIGIEMNDRCLLLPVVLAKR